MTKSNKINYPEKDLLNLLESIILMQMLVENLEEMQFTHFNVQKVKMQTNNLIKELTPIIEKDYNTVYRNGDDETIKIINNYESLVKSISMLQLPPKVLISQFTHAWNIDSKRITGIVDKILKKSNKKQNEKVELFTSSQK